MDRINEALEFEAGNREVFLDRQDLRNRLSSLSACESEVFHRVAAGDLAKVIGADLGISERTVEAHRSQVMSKLGIQRLVRIKLEAELMARSEEPSVRSKGQN